ncbi:MAG: hypothetical protein B7Z55_01725 [Planctomycetales bacterium 12-60-4]|nr:MAG: hypothetical protein B7Z55_01725 [Planctomycetales bacterium 12-60-4]
MLINAKRRRPTASRGFTIIEFLVTLSAFSLLIGLLLPAVQKVRAAATQMNVEPTLRPLGVEVLAHSGDVAILDLDSVDACRRILRNRDVATGSLGSLLTRYDDAVGENARLLDLVQEAIATEQDMNRLTLLMNAFTALAELNDALIDTQDRLEQLKNGGR